MEQSLITVILQGPIHSNVVIDGRTYSSGDLVKRARAAFPQAELILSTWDHEDTEDFDVDRVVVASDPGATTFQPRGERRPIVNNFNRMVVSTTNGLRAATRPYILKLRTDILVSSDSISNLYDRLRADAKQPGIFDEPVLVPELYTRHPLRSSLLFHPSDMVQFGLKSDLEAMWNTQLLTSADARTFEADWSKGLSPLASEQRLLVNYLRKIGARVAYRHSNVGSLFDVFRSQRVISKSFLIGEADQMGLSFPDRFNTWSCPWTCFTAREWQILARPKSVIRRLGLSLLVFVKIHTKRIIWLRNIVRAVVNWRAAHAPTQETDVRGLRRKSFVAR